jgi:hypothetical protein
MQMSLPSTLEMKSLLMMMNTLMREKNERESEDEDDEDYDMHAYYKLGKHNVMGI